MSYESIVATINDLERQIKERIKMDNDAGELALLITCNAELKHARRGAEALKRISTIMEGLVAWRTQTLKLK